tara:strand:- start:29915 stop:30070 length:156 start_codon:yes stop_codon:yes gene_type:complete
MCGFSNGYARYIPMGDHIVKTWQHTSRDELDARWVSVGIPEDADDIDLLQV